MPASSRAFLFPDVNVWVALTYEGHVAHLPARKWFDRLGREVRFCFCRFTQISLLRLLSTEAVMGRDEVMSQTDAWSAYDRWMEDDRTLFLPEPPGLEPSFRSLSQLRRPAPKDWADSYLAAFALVSGLKLVTFDRALQARTRDSVILGGS